MVKIINIDTKTRTIHVSNAEGKNKAWRTTESGAHFPIKEGESTKEALDKFVGSKRPKAKKSSYEEVLGPGEHDYYEGPDNKMIEYVTDLAKRKKAGEKLSKSNEAYLKQWGKFIGTTTDKIGRAHV